MGAVLFALLVAVRDAVRHRTALEAELLALRHQLLVLQRQRGWRGVQLRAVDRLFWVALARLWSHWRDALILVKPETVIGYTEVERLTADAKMNRLAAFNDIAKRTGRAAGTVAANYYRIARKRGAPLRARRGRNPGRPSGKGVIAAVAVAIRRLAALLQEQAQELAALRKDSRSRPVILEQPVQECT